jgi:selenide,water dikinase
LGPGDLARVLCDLKLVKNENLLVGLESGDDAGVVRLTDEIALIQTVDFFTPIADDPYLFGQIAAANALSDVYAMGGRPLCAMNIVCFPKKDMEISILTDVLKGGLSKIHEADAVLVGGHSIEDRELKYGLSVTGVVHPQEVLTNRGAQALDALVLTKPLGTGIIATAVKGDMATDESQEVSIASMTALNRKAAEALEGLSVHACTDVTGFGLIGHLAEMIQDSDVGAVIRSADVPILPSVEEYCNLGLLPGGLHRNRDFRAGMVELGASVPRHLQDALHDPQTSGGLLVALPSEEAQKLLSGLDATIIGGVVLDHPGKILVR